MILADLELEGASRKVLMQAPKNGFFYVLDRLTGELLSAENFVPVNWASHIDLETGRPVLTGDAYYKDEPKVVYPFMAGAHNWPPMSYSPRTGLVYIPAQDGKMRYRSQPEYEYRPGETNVGVSGGGPVLRDGRPDMQKMLIAWDPVAQQEIWSTPDTPGLQDGGVLTTAGNLVFQGTASGHFIAYRADTGEKLKDIEAGTGIMAGAMTYALDGEQYVAVMAGFGGAPTGWLPGSERCRPDLREPWPNPGVQAGWRAGSPAAQAHRPRDPRAAGPRRLPRHSGAGGHPLRATLRAVPRRFRREPQIQLPGPDGNDRAVLWSLRGHRPRGRPGRPRHGGLLGRPRPGRLGGHPRLPRGRAEKAPGRPSPAVESSRA